MIPHTDTELVGESAKVEVMTAIKILSQKMEDLQACYDLISKHGSALQKSLSEIESSYSAAEMNTKVKAINERATLFRIASNKMINVSTRDELAIFVKEKKEKINVHTITDLFGVLRDRPSARS